ncbi:hypothetical protein [Halpernia frigidisoli]|uniref:Outer membrane protein beta-barrel domain-containing protein n=1 Tax=Halpernia frigidisoli TaxID=1125876 RepID=A0A1I3ILF7_9FLAO|nr:hypothetical protein [Halpernia frigidisoli]SFI48814.1 hypothetical protein SAMN05443292_2681 [Halpernia frigidisoli]
MKMIKQTILGLGLLTAGIATAQSAKMTNILKVGVNAGVTVPNGNASASVGADLSYQYLVTPGFGLGVATGYNQFFGKDNNNDFAVIPAALLLRYYPMQTGFYAGADVGYGFITGNDFVNSNSTVQRPDGGFYLKPELGYHNTDWNFFVHYTKVFTGDKGQIGSQKYNAGTIGAGVAYNIPLGKKL